MKNTYIMFLKCKNCNNYFKGKYCNNCGQSSATHEINFNFLWHDIQHGLLHCDKGIFFTIKHLLTRPGDTVNDFINGKQARHFKPIALVIILATIYGVLCYSLEIDFVYEIKEKGAYSSDEIAFYKKLDVWISNHYSWVTLIEIPLYSLGSFVAFWKQNKNFAEHLVLNTFLIGQRLVYYIITFPILYIYNGTSILWNIEGALSVVDFIFIFWSYTQFFNKLSTLKSFFLTLLAYLIFLASSILIYNLTCTLIMQILSIK